MAKAASENTAKLLEANNYNNVVNIAYQLNNSLLDHDNLSIWITIDGKMPVLRKNGGKFSEAEIEKYLDVYEVLGVLYDKNRDRLVQDELLCDLFFDKAVLTLNNPEIERYLDDRRKTYPSYLSNLTTLKEAVDTFEMCPEFN